MEKGRSQVPGARGRSSGRSGGAGVTSVTGTASGGASGAVETAVQEQQSSRQLQPADACRTGVFECFSADAPWQQCPQEVSPFVANLGAEQTPEQVYLWSSGAAMSVTRNTAACRSARTRAWPDVSNRMSDRINVSRRLGKAL